MKYLLLILFLILWKFNSNICDYFYSSSDQFTQWYYLRCKIYEAMFFMAVWLFVLTKPSRILLSIAWGGLVYIGCSVIDKVLIGNHTELLRDWYVVLPASIFIGILIYIKNDPKKDI